MYPRKLRGKVFYTCNSKSNGTNCGSKGQIQDNLIKNIIESIKKSLELFSVYNQEELESRKKLYKREFSKIEKQEETLLRKYLEDTVEEKIYNRLVKELQEKKSFYKEELKKIEKLISNQNVTLDSIELLREYIKVIKETKDIEKLSLLFKVVINEIIFVNDFRVRQY